MSQVERRRQARREEIIFRFDSREQLEAEVARLEAALTRGMGTPAEPIRTTAWVGGPQGEIEAGET